MAQYYGAPPSAYYNPAQFLGPDPLREAIPAIRNLGDDLKAQSKYEDSQAAYANKQIVSQQQFAKELAEEKDKNLKTYEVAVAKRKASIKKAEAEQRDRENKLAFDKEKNEQDKAKAAEEKRIQDRLEKNEDKAWDFITKLDTTLKYPERVKAVGQTGFMNIPSVKAQMEREEKIYLARQKNWRTGQVVKGRGDSKVKIKNKEQYLAKLDQLKKSVQNMDAATLQYGQGESIGAKLGKDSPRNTLIGTTFRSLEDELVDYVGRNPQEFGVDGELASLDPGSVINTYYTTGDFSSQPAPQATPSVNTQSKPPEAAIGILEEALGDNEKTNAEKAQVVQFFENKYGKGSAAPYLK